MTERLPTRLVFALIAAVVIAMRLVHSSVLWADDNLPLAAAIQVFHGKALYRDVWYDKPPLVVWTYLLWAARSGVALRLAGAMYVIGVSVAAWQIARKQWSEREGLYAAIFGAFFLTFALPSAVIPLASDMLLILPHLVAIYFAWRGRPLWSGAAAGVGLLYSSKAVFVLAACALWQWRSLPMLVLGFAMPNAIALAWMWAQGSLGEFYTQVWQWGSIYAANTFVENPVVEGLKRTAGWIGFQAALVIGMILAVRRDWRYLAWIGIALVGVILGLRFFPRYYFLLVPPAIVLGARGWASLNKPVLLAVLLAIPLLRFAPGYVTLPERDLVMDRDSRAAAAELSARAVSRETLFVWGFRPDIFIDSGLPAGTRFLESQPISGVLADRHLFSARPVTADFLEENRAELIRSRPTWVVDGLGPFNDSLALAKQESLAAWFAQYREVARTRFSILYRLR